MSLLKMIWIVGAGYMAEEYLKVILEKKVEVIVIGRGESNCIRLEAKYNTRIIKGGLRNDLLDELEIPEYVIVCVPILSSFEVISKLISYGVKRILLEKPGFLEEHEFNQINEIIESKDDVRIFIAYNRRYYNSVIELQKRVDGKIESVHFEFNEWAHRVAQTNHPPKVKEKWLQANSSHVIDLVFFLIGKPRSMHCFQSGYLPWHTSGSIFIGSGKTDRDIPFSYNSNWTAPGRWSIEIKTEEKSFLLAPLESLKQKEIGELEYTDIELPVDPFKPGLQRQVEAFLCADYKKLKDLKEQVLDLRLFNKIQGSSQ